MGLKSNVPLILVLVLSLYVSATLSFDPYSRGRDPHQEFQQCRRRCHTEESEPHKQLRCDYKCREEFDRHTDQRGSRQSESYDTDLDLTSVNPQQELEQCREVCRMKRWSPEMVHRCEKECEDKFERQQGRGRGRGGSYDDERMTDLDFNSDEPQRELEKCQSRCRSLRWSPAMVHHCEKECEDEFHRQRGSGRGSGSYDDERKTDLDFNSDEQELERCQSRCRSLRWSPMAVHRCEKECEDKFQRREQGRGRGGRGSYDDDEDMIMRNHHHGGSGERRYEACQRKCESEGRRGQSQQWQCQRRCQEEFEREGEGEGGRGHRHHDHGSKEETRTCRERCEEQGYGYDCKKRCRQESQGGGRRGRDGLAKTVLSALFA